MRTPGLALRRICVLALLGFLAARLLPAADRHVSSPDAAPRTSAVRDKPVSAERLVRLFRANGEEGKLKALHDVAPAVRDDPNAAAALWQAIDMAAQSRKFGPSLLAAVRLYGEGIDPRRGARLLSLLSGDDPALVLAAVEGLARHRDPEALPAIARLTERPEYRERYGFRYAVMTAVAQYREPEAVDWLINVVEKSDGQLKYEAARRLAGLTGENLGGKSADWRDWWKANRARFADIQTALASAPPANLPTNVPWNFAAPKFFNTSIYALRVAFVIDRSGSMESSVDDVTGLDEAQRQLEQAVRGLPTQAYFDIVAYDSSVRLWQDRLVPANQANRSDAVRFCYSLFPDSKTDSYGALASALALDPNLELIVFLSDGEPTAGRIVDPRTIVQQITTRNAQQRTAIDSWSVDAVGPGADFLKQLSDSNFGAFQPIR